jgi:hypothetical protein
LSDGFGHRVGGVPGLAPAAIRRDRRSTGGSARPAAQRHLDDEEQNVVPLAAVTLTQQEWDALGKHGLAQMPGNKRRIAFGMILDPLDEAERAYMKGFLPAPVRMLYPFLIGRPWKKYANRLRTGT